MSDLGSGELPEVITLSRRGRCLRLRWLHGGEAEIEASLLRAKCRCSGCLHAARGEHPQAGPGSDIAILELRQIGSTGLQAVFSDGHERGIYPWSYLSAIAGIAPEEGA
jgi:DUF971 family protein